VHSIGFLLGNLSIFENCNAKTRNLSGKPEPQPKGWGE
jgi:hypothetical protein